MSNVEVTAQERGELAHELDHEALHNDRRTGLNMKNKLSLLSETKFYNKILKKLFIHVCFRDGLPYFKK